MAHFLTISELEPTDFPLHQRNTVSQAINPHQYSLPSDLHSQLLPVVAATGLTQLNNTHAYLKCHKQAHKRLELLLNIKKTVITPLKPDQHLTNIVFDNFYDSNYQELQDHIQYTKLTISLLDIYNTIDQIQSGQINNAIKEWRKYMSANPATHIKQIFNQEIPKPQPKDKAALMVVEMQLKSRRVTYIQRLKNAVSLAHNQGWYMAFDTLTLSDDGVSRFYKDPHAIRDYCRKVGRLVNESLGLPKDSSTADNYQFFCVPEYGTKNGRLHFHIIHLMKKLPLNTRDPNFGLQNPTNRLLPTLRGLWSYGMSMPLMVRYHTDKYGRDGWRSPADSVTGEKLDTKPVDAVCNYIAKYIAKQTDYKIAMKLKRGKEQWIETTQSLHVTTERHFRVRMSRNFGMKLLPSESMENLPMKTLIQLTQLHYNNIPIHKILLLNSKKEMSLRLGALTIENLQELMPETPNLLKSLRDSMQGIQNPNLRSSINTAAPKLTSTDISNETAAYIALVHKRFNKPRLKTTGSLK